MRCLNDAYFFDQVEADRAVYFIENFCSHVSGSLSGRPFILQRWQAALVREAFGRKTLDGRRRYSHVWLEAPRKSGKSTLGAAISLYMLLVDKELGARGYVVASRSDHARICLGIAKKMIDNSADMRCVCQIRHNEITYKDNRIGTMYGAPAVGLDISFAILDDMQVGVSRELYFSIISGSACRKEPLFFCLVGAGCNRNTAAWDLHQYAVEVSSGRITDPKWLVYLFGAGNQDDWSDPAVWAKAHPGLNITVSEHVFREQCERALHSPAHIDGFRRSYLNVWTETAIDWMDMDLWDSCRVSLDPLVLQGRRCKIGLDLSSSTDLTAVVVVFPEIDGGYTVLPFAFLPAVSMEKRSLLEREQYLSWSSAGYLTLTEGNTVDYYSVRDKIIALCEEYDVQELAYDRWGATMLVNHLVEDGVRCAPVNQDASTLTSSVREIERVVRNRTFRHDGNPVLRWCASNVTLISGKGGHLKPAKRKSRGRIDLIVAIFLAVTRLV